MTREEAKKLLPIIQAFAEGKTIQFRERDIEEPSFDGCINEYRIKPEPKYRPFKTQEEYWNEMLKHQPFGWLKNKNQENALLIGNVFDIWIVFATEEPNKFHSISKVFDDYLFADGTPFGIKE